MTTAVLTPGGSARATAERALKASALFWFATVVTGQALFLIYILAVYAPTSLTGNFAAWNANKMLIKGYVPGDTAGNLAFAAHVLMAAVVTFGGTVQMVPQIRARAPAVHRWVGRAFMTTAMLASVVGLWMTWGRPTSSGLPAGIAITLDAVLILTFGSLAWRTAVTRDVAAHRRWALRTFMVANGVWFLRLGMATYGMAYMASGKVLMKPGDFFDLWSFGGYLVPLLVLELYLRAKAGGGPTLRISAAGVVTLGSLLMAVGIFGTWIGMFFPVIDKIF